MGESKLTAAQVAVLQALANVVPPWRLVGGGALAGFHTHHRATRDLDLFWSRSELGEIVDDISTRLAAAGFRTEALQRAPAFCRLRVARGQDVVVVDLVADSVPTVVDPAERTLGNTRILVESPHEILVSKLCALLSRSELRDLEDVQALLETGGDLERAMSDAPRKDAGFSPLTFAWVLEQLPIAAMGRALQRGDDEVRRLEAFRDRLVADVLSLSKPG